MLSVMKALVLAGLVGTVSGCAAIGAVAYKVAGDVQTPAEYKPADKPTLVLVENYQNPDQYRNAATQMERDIAEELKKNKVTQVVGVEKLEILRSGDVERYRKMRIDEVGKAVGAKQVIYVNLVKFNAATPIGSGEMSGLCEGMVRVIDVETGRTLWPTDTSAGRAVKYETKHEEAVDFSSHSAVQDQMSAAMSDRVARLFYANMKWENGVGPKTY